MTVAFLIAALSTFPLDAEVVVDNSEWGEDSPTVYFSEPEQGGSGKVVIV